MPRRSPALAPAIGLLLTTACAAGDTTGERLVTTRDSAGVAIVENTGPEVPDSQVIRSLEEDLRIGVVEGDARYQLHDVYDVAVGADGTIYVANNGTASVRIYASDGTHVRDLGGQGGGPGEFPRMVNAIWVENDTLVAIDWQGDGRINVWGPEGELIESRNARVDGDQSFPRAGLPGRWIGGAPMDYASTQAILTATLTTVDDSAFLPVDGGELLTFPTRPLYPSDNGEGGVDWPLFTVEPALAVGPGDRMAYHGGFPYEYRVHDLQGRLQRVVRRTWDAIPVTEALFERYRELQVGFYDSLAAEHGPDARRGLEQAAERTERQFLLPRPDTIAPMGRMVMGPDGAVWIERRDLGDVATDQFQAIYGGFNNAPPGPSRWDIFDPEGRFLHAVELPDGFEPFAATVETVTGVLTDDLGVQYVVRYRPRFPGPGSG